MKILKWKRAAAACAAVLASALLLSCGASVEDTSANYAEAEKNATTTKGSTSRVAKSGKVDCSSATLTVGQWSQSSVLIGSYARLNTDTLDEAVTFYSLKDNTDNEKYYPMHDAKLEKKALDISEEEITSNGEKGIITTIHYDVNLTNVTSEKIVLLVDATKLKDKSGNAVLNLNKNEKAGEEGDSFVKYISTTGTTTLHNEAKEDFDPDYPLDFNNPSTNYFGFPGAPVQLKNKEGKLTGQLRFTAETPVSTEPIAAEKTYDSSWAETLNKIILFRSKAADATEWKTETVSFQYYAEADDSNTYALIAAHTCVADTPVLAPGTQWEVVVKVTPNISAPSWYAKVFGHAGYLFAATKEYTIAADTLVPSLPKIYSGTSETYVTSPSYLVTAYDPSAASETTWVPQNITDAAIKSVQNALFDVEVKARRGSSSKWDSSTSSYIYPYSAWEWEITPEADVSLADASDFKVTDGEWRELDSTVSVIKNSNGDIIKIYVTLKNTAFIGENAWGAYSPTTIPNSVKPPVLWVGHGTKLKQNVEYPSQLECGMYNDSMVPEAIRGYVKIEPDGSSVK